MVAFFSIVARLKKYAHDYRKSATIGMIQSVRSWTDEQLLMEIIYDALILDQSSAPPECRSAACNAARLIS